MGVFQAYCAEQETGEKLDNWGKERNGPCLSCSSSSFLLELTIKGNAASEAGRKAWVIQPIARFFQVFHAAILPADGGPLTASPLS